MLAFLKRKTSSSEVTETVAEVSSGVAVASTSVSTTCQICLCDDEVVSGETLCGDNCQGKYCRDCLKTYFTNVVESGFQGGCPRVKCPAEKCRDQIIQMVEWIPHVTPETFSRFHLQAQSVVSFQCSSCHSRRSLLFSQQGSLDELPNATEFTVFPGSVYCVEQLVRSLRAFQRGDMTSGDALKHIVGSWRLNVLQGTDEAAKTLQQSKVTVGSRFRSIFSRSSSGDTSTSSPACPMDEAVEASVEQIIMVAREGGKVSGEGHLADTDRQNLGKAVAVAIKAINDHERRANLQSTYLNTFSSFWTPCCNSKHCYRCRVSGFHDRRSCSSVRSAANVSRNRQGPDVVLNCPSCNLQLVKGDGCDSVTCLCGHHLSWNTEVKRAAEALTAGFRAEHGENAAEVAALIGEGVLEGDSEVAGAVVTAHQIDVNAFFSKQWRGQMPELSDLDVTALALFQRRAFNRNTGVNGRARPAAPSATDRAEQASSQWISSHRSDVRIVERARIQGQLTAYMALNRAGRHLINVVLPHVASVSTTITAATTAATTATSPFNNDVHSEFRATSDVEEKRQMAEVAFVLGSKNGEVLGDVSKVWVGETARKAKALGIRSQHYELKSRTEWRRMSKKRLSLRPQRILEEQTTSAKTTNPLRLSEERVSFHPLLTPASAPASASEQHQHGGEMEEETKEEGVQQESKCDDSAATATTTATATTPTADSLGVEEGKEGAEEEDDALSDSSSTTSGPSTEVDDAATNEIAASVNAGVPGDDAIPAASISPNLDIYFSRNLSELQSRHRSRDAMQRVIYGCVNLGVSMRSLQKFSSVFAATDTNTVNASTIARQLLRASDWTRMVGVERAAILSAAIVNPNPQEQSMVKAMDLTKFHGFWTPQLSEKAITERVKGLAAAFGAAFPMEVSYYNGFYVLVRSKSFQVTPASVRSSIVEYMEECFVHERVEKASAEAEGASRTIPTLTGAQWGVWWDRRERVHQTLKWLGLTASTTTDGSNRPRVSQALTQAAGAALAVVARDVSDSANPPNELIAQISRELDMVDGVVSSEEDRKQVRKLKGLKVKFEVTADEEKAGNSGEGSGGSVVCDDVYDPTKLVSSLAHRQHDMDTLRSAVTAMLKGGLGWKTAVAASKMFIECEPKVVASAKALERSRLVSDWSALYGVRCVMAAAEWKFGHRGRLSAWTTEEEEKELGYVVEGPSGLLKVAEEAEEAEEEVVVTEEVKATTAGRAIDAWSPLYVAPTAAVEELFEDPNDEREVPTEPPVKALESPEEWARRTGLSDLTVSEMVSAFTDDPVWSTAVQQAASYFALQVRDNNFISAPPMLRRRLLWLARQSAVTFAATVLERQREGLEAVVDDKAEEEKDEKKAEEKETVSCRSPTFMDVLQAELEQLQALSQAVTGRIGRPRRRWARNKKVEFLTPPVVRAAPDVVGKESGVYWMDVLAERRLWVRSAAWLGRFDGHMDAAVLAATARDLSFPRLVPKEAWAFNSALLKLPGGKRANTTAKYVLRGEIKAREAGAKALPSNGDEEKEYFEALACRMAPPVEDVTWCVGRRTRCAKLQKLLQHVQQQEEEEDDGDNKESGGGVLCAEESKEEECGLGESKAEPELEISPVRRPPVLARTASSGSVEARSMRSRAPVSLSSVFTSAVLGDDGSSSAAVIDSCLTTAAVAMMNAAVVAAGGGGHKRSKTVGDSVVPSPPRPPAAVAAIRYMPPAPPVLVPALQHTTSPVFPRPPALLRMTSC